MPGLPRSSPERARDLVLISDMYLHGYSMRQIDDKLAEIRPGAHSYRTVCNDIKRLHEIWTEKAVENHTKQIEAALARIDYLEREAYDQWELSKRGTTETTLYSKAGEDGNPVLEQAVTRDLENEGLGDRQWWDRMLMCVEQRIRLIETGVSMRAVGVAKEHVQWAQKAQENRAQWKQFATQGRLNPPDPAADPDGECEEPDVDQR